MLSNSILNYQGPLSFSTIDALLSEFKVAAQEHQLSFRIYKKMLSIMIEALENISKYSDQFECDPPQAEEGFCPMCQINRNSKDIELVTRNPVKKDDVEELRLKIDMVNSRNREELKLLYRTTITNGQFSPKGGAGLGLIEMVKTTGNKLEYQFENLNKDYSMYTLRAVMNL